MVQHSQHYSGGMIYILGLDLSGKENMYCQVAMQKSTHKVLLYMNMFGPGDTRQTSKNKKHLQCVHGWDICLFCTYMNIYFFKNKY